MREGVARFFAYLALSICPEVFGAKEEPKSTVVSGSDFDSFLEAIRGSDLMLADGSWYTAEEPAEYRIDLDGNIYTRSRYRASWEPMEGIAGICHLR